MEQSASLNEIGEYELHREIAQLLNSPGSRVVGDDSAALSLPERSELLISVDRLARGVAADVRARLLVTQTVSDIIVCNGLPIAVLLAVQAEPSMRAEELLTFVAQVNAVAKEYGCALIGGDTKEGESFSAVGVGLGLRRPGASIRRVGVAPGDVIAVTLAKGQKWGGRWANHLVHHYNLRINESLKESLYRTDYDFALPVLETYAAIDSGAVAAGLDLSDGIGASLKILAEANQLDFDVETERLRSLVDLQLVEEPAQLLEIDPMAFALSPGYMWNNLFVLSKAAVNVAIEAVSATGGSLVPIGRAAVGDGSVTLDGRPSGALDAASDEKFRAWRWDDRTQWWLDQMPRSSR